jgi:hypothetical protein
MIKIKTNSKQFQKEMNNIVNFSAGFFEGVHRGKGNFSENLAKESLEALKQFIDSNARVNPDALHHMYEWHSTGSPEARLFDIEYTSRSNGISFRSSFRQSNSVRAGSKVPFYNKAEIMEKGLSVTIKPIVSNVLVFEEGGKTVFTKKEVVVTNPGGAQTAGSYEQVFNQFFSSYFSQAFLLSSRVMEKISDTSDFTMNFSKAKTGGRAAGVRIGFRWMSTRGESR